MKYDEKDLEKFLDLLLPYKSEETKRTRRNLSVLGFLIVSSQILGLKISDITFMGLDVSRSEAAPLFLIIAALDFYWLLLFGTLLVRDHEVQNERSFLFAVKREAIEKAYQSHVVPVLEIRKTGQPMSLPYGGQEIVDAYESLQHQLARTRRAKTVDKIFQSIETLIPGILGVFTMLFLSRELWVAIVVRYFVAPIFLH